jgi:hypothetical protein
VCVCVCVCVWEGGREKEHLLTPTSSTLNLVMIRLVTKPCHAVLCCAMRCQMQLKERKDNELQRKTTQSGSKRPFFVNNHAVIHFILVVPKMCRIALSPKEQT